MPTSLGIGFEYVAISVEGPSLQEAEVVIITETGDEFITELGDVIILES